MQVVKADGSKEVYQEIKVANSIQRAGIPRQLQQQVLDHVNKKVYDNIPSSQIYQHVLEYLDASPQPFSKSKYSLKQSIMQLGPTGYPFEDFIAKLLEQQGYTTQVRQILMGRCVSHEIDVVATKGDKKIMVEAKFHNEPGARSDVHVPLYTKSRFEDIKVKHHIDEAWILTNTKATTDAIAYGACIGMRIISWSYPDGESFRDMLEQTHMHPVTMLTSLSLQQKAELLNNHIVLCKDVYKKPELLDILHLSQNQRKNVLDELSYICKTESAA